MDCDQKLSAIGLWRQLLSRFLEIDCLSRVLLQSPLSVNDKDDNEMRMDVQRSLGIYLTAEETIGKLQLRGRLIISYVTSLRYVTRYAQPAKEGEVSKDG